MDKALQQIQITLDALKKESEGFEFWSARELMGFLGYATWQKFSDAIERAKESCKLSSQDVSDHFLPAPVKSSGGRPKEDLLLTRYINEVLHFRSNLLLSRISTLKLFMVV